MTGVIAAAILIVVYILFLIWYYWFPKPLTKEEVERYVSIMAGRSGGDNKMSSVLRKFADEDDGKQFFMVSMEKYYDKPQYKDGDHGITSEGANKRYAMNTMRLMLKRAGHPYGIFIPLINLSNINRQDDSVWDNVSLVRYRSRRDFLNMVTSPQWHSGYGDKVAALRENPNMPSKGLLALPIMPILVLTIFLFIGFMIMLCVSITFHFNI